MPSRFPDISGASPAQARNFSFFFFFFVRGGERVASSRSRSARGRSAPAAAQEVRAWTGARVALCCAAPAPARPGEGCWAPQQPHGGAPAAAAAGRPPLPPRLPARSGRPPQTPRGAASAALSRVGRIREEAGGVALGPALGHRHAGVAAAPGASRGRSTLGSLGPRRGRGRIAPRRAHRGARPRARGRPAQPDDAEGTQRCVRKVPRFGVHLVHTEKDQKLTPGRVGDSSVRRGRDLIR